MGEDRLKRIVIFGGTGFIGTHLAQHMLDSPETEHVLLVDLNPPRTGPYVSRLTEGLQNGRASYIQGDVRESIAPEIFAAPDIIFNFAAIHREPGHVAHEYYVTNIKGAENVCDYADATGCKRMVFTSSISPYGPSEETKNEDSIPVPETAYGGSKLVAEKIHTAWRNKADDRKLLIMRPGVVYGPGEGGNVTRLVRSVVKGYFAFMGNRNTRKAGGYVKELCEVMLFGLHHQDVTGEQVTLLNFSLDPPRTLEDFVTTIRDVAGIKRTPFSVPQALLVGVSYPIDAVAKILCIQQPISPVRMKKLARSTNIEPKRLRMLGYQYKYTFIETFEDWKKDKPEDFGQ